MFLAHVKKGIVTPMKCGTHTVHKVGREMARAQNDAKIRAPMYMGHHHYSKLFQDAVKGNHSPFELAQHIRDPIDRMVSCLNHQYGRRHHPRMSKNPMDLDQILRKLEEERALKDTKSRALFPPQIAFWHYDCTLFRFEGFEIVRWLGWKDEIPHEYASNKRFTRPQVEAHPICEYIMNEYGYKYDYTLREMVGVKREI